MVLIIRDSLSEAYLAMLQDTVSTPSFMQVTHVRTPVVNGELNLDEAFRKKFEDYQFPDGRTGLWWLAGRIEAVFSPKGEYYERIIEGGYGYCLNALKGMAEGRVARWNANRLIVTLFDPSKDLHTSRAPTPPCMTLLSFYPVRQELNLTAVFRAQYTDAKAFGNLTSLAMLLEEVCEKTSFKPASLYNIAQKPILKYPKAIAKQLLIHLMGA